MTEEELLSHIHELGIELGFDVDDLDYSAPRGMLTQELRAELAEHKADILTLLREAHTSVPPDPRLWRSIVSRLVGFDALAQQGGSTNPALQLGFSVLRRRNKDDDSD